jgi:hypothetical protein
MKTPSDTSTRPHEPPKHVPTSNSLQVPTLPVPHAYANSTAILVSAKRTLPKHPDRRIIHLRHALTRIPLIFVGKACTVLIHVLLKVLVNELLRLAPAAFLQLVVAVTEVMTETRVMDYCSRNVSVLSEQETKFALSVQSKPNGSSGDEEHPSADQSIPSAASFIAARAARKASLVMLKR